MVRQASGGKAGHEMRPRLPEKEVTGPAAVQGLSPDTPVEEAAAKLLHARFADLRKHEIHAVTRLDPDAVHDLRVSCRRVGPGVKGVGGKTVEKVDPLGGDLPGAPGEGR